MHFHSPFFFFSSLSVHFLFLWPSNKRLMYIGRERKPFEYHRHFTKTEMWVSGCLRRSNGLELCRMYEISFFLHFLFCLSRRTIFWRKSKSRRRLVIPNIQINTCIFGKKRKKSKRKKKTFVTASCFSFMYIGITFFRVGVLWHINSITHSVLWFSCNS